MNALEKAHYKTVIKFGHAQELQENSEFRKRRLKSLLFLV